MITTFEAVRLPEPEAGDGLAWRAGSGMRTLHSVTVVSPEADLAVTPKDGISDWAAAGYGKAPRGGVAERESGAAVFGGGIPCVHAVTVVSQDTNLTVTPKGVVSGLGAEAYGDQASGGVAGSAKPEAGR